MRRCLLRKTWVVLYVSKEDSAVSFVRLMVQVRHIFLLIKFAYEVSADFLA